MASTHVPQSTVIRRIRLLFVDDQEPLLRSARKFFGLRDGLFHVVAVNSAAAAIQALEAAPVDVIVTDVSMPDISGCQLHSLVAQRWPRLASSFLFVSGGLVPEDRAYVDATGCEFFEKPVDMLLLAEAVEKVFEAACERESVEPPSSESA